MARIMMIGAVAALVVALGVWVLADAREEHTMTTRYAGQTEAADFPRNAQWLNTSRPYTMRDFRGKIVMLDFWTYCCINCMHIIPDLKRLEGAYAEELVVIGVHSAKFTTERDVENIRQAILRYEIAHPVVNDADFRIWRAYGAHAWPTIALIDPNGKLVTLHSGEGVFDTFDPIIAEMVGHFDSLGELDRTPIRFDLEATRSPASLLSFPGKIVADARNDRLYISDSNNNRIVVTTLADASGTAEVVGTIGSGAMGRQDGPAETASFNRPQGMALHDGTLYIADTENHLIRAVDLLTREVRTIAGTGQQARATNRPGVGTGVALNSPWDLLARGEKLYIAMAGSHQIWVFGLRSRTAEPFAGSGREDRIDGTLRGAALAQPSGLASDGEHLYVADSEVSAIRRIGLSPNGRVETLAGGELFEFGLKDGRGTEARFQHPIGVAWHDGTVLVADTYNNVIRAIDAGTGRVRVFLGDGQAGFRDGDSPRFDEPNDVEVARDLLYIADTNNHRIRVAPVSGGPVKTLTFSNPEALRVIAADEAAPEPSRRATVDAQTVAPGASEIRVDVRFPDGYKLNGDAPSSYTVMNLDGGDLLGDRQENVRVSTLPIRIPVRLDEGTGKIAVDLVLYYCEEESKSLCYFTHVRLEIPLTVRSDARERSIAATYRVNVQM